METTMPFDMPPDALPSSLDRVEPEALSRAEAYPLIARAIHHLVQHWRDQPSLEALAEEAGLSPHHFQRVFKRWAGISPKRFVQFLTLDHARRLLEAEASLLDAAYEVGLSGPSRLHDLFLSCEAVTPGSFKARGAGLVLRWGLHASPFGPALVAVSDKGVSWLGFARDDGPAGLEAEFRADWPAARLERDQAGTAAAAARAFAFWQDGTGELRLHLTGTNFQIKVWEALLRIPPGRVASYAEIARRIDRPRAVRAVGAAVGANPVSLVIPCHRVIQSSGAIHAYRWGVGTKRALLACEFAAAAAE